MKTLWNLNQGGSHQSISNARPAPIALPMEFSSRDTLPEARGPIVVRPPFRYEDHHVKLGRCCGCGRRQLKTSR